jgi:hypothetical protein
MNSINSIKSVKSGSNAERGNQKAKAQAKTKLAARALHFIGSPVAGSPLRSVGYEPEAVSACIFRG